MKIGKRLGAWLLAGALTFGMLPAPAARAEEVPAAEPVQEEQTQPIQREQSLSQEQPAPEESPVVSSGRNWTLTADGTLTVNGPVRYQTVHGRFDKMRQYEWDDQKDKIYTVVVQDGVTELPDAFIGCVNLRRATLADTVTDLKRTFYECSSLVEANIPTSAQNLEDTFYSCKNLRSITIPEGIKSLYGTFANSGLKEVTIPASVTDLRSAFYGSELEKVTFQPGSSRDTLGQSAFWGCDGLAELHVPEGVKVIEQYAVGNSTYSVGRRLFLPASLETLHPNNLKYRIAEINYAGTSEQWAAVAKLDGDPTDNGMVVHTADGDWIPVRFEENLISFNGGYDYVKDQKAVTGKPYGKLPDDSWIRTDDIIFLGWYTKPVGGERVTEETIVPDGKESTLYAHWQSNFVEVEFKVEMTNAERRAWNEKWGLDQYSGTKKIHKGEPYGELPVPERAGYTFEGWYTAEEGGTKVESTTIVTVPEGKQTVSGTEEQTLYPRWLGNLCTVTFDAQGGSVDVKNWTLRNGEKYGTLPTPTRTGYTFDGWYTAARGGYKVSAETKLTGGQDLTLYAHWLGAEVTVSLDAQGGNVSTKSIKVRYGGSYGSLPNPTRSNYTFEGWYTAPTGGSKVEYNTAVERTEDHTLYARWKGRSFTVILNAQGGSVYVSRLEVTNGEPYGELPVPTRTGYEFEGWYTATTGGVKITESTKVELQRTQTLYAHWKGAEITVTFDAQGGSGGARSTKVRYGEPYGSLPTPTKENYEFVGWFTALTGGSQVTERTKVSRSENHVLYARWLGKARTVTLDPQGGTLYGARSGSVRMGEVYGSLLNIPYREGYDFVGWYTAREGGEAVDSATVMELDRDHTLYARWKERTRSTLEKLSYNFSNSWSGFGYPSNYRIPYERFKLVFGDTALSRSYYNSNGYWGGNCFGMSSTAGMFFQEGNGVDTTDFNADAKRPYELDKNDKNFAWDVSVRDFIEAMQISQKGSLIQRDYRNNKNKLNELCRAVSNFQNTGKEPVVIAVFGRSSGHAIVGYELEEVSATESRLMVYDCNYPGSAQYITLTKDASGNYTGWRYSPLGWGSSSSGCWISYVPYSHFMKMWNDRAGAADSRLSLLNVSSSSATVYDANGTVAAVIENGTVVSSREDVYPMITADVLAEGTAGATQGTALWLPADLYTVTNNDPSVKNFQATMVNVDQYASVTTSGERVTFAVNDSLGMNYVELSEAGSSYTIQLNSSLEKGYEDVQLTGTTGEETMAFAQVDGMLYVRGMILKSGALKIDGQSVTVNNVSDQMPDVSAMLQEKEIHFSDVSESSWYADAVRYVVARGLFSGTSKTTFSPNMAMSRGMLMTVLARYAGVDTKGGSIWYEKGMEWARANKVSDGTNPGGNVTREQIAVMLYRYVGSPKVSGEGLNAFPDRGAVSSWARNAMAWAVSNGIIKGAGGRLNPGGTASRAEVATMLMRLEALSR